MKGCVSPTVFAIDISVKVKQKHLNGLELVLKDGQVERPKVVLVEGGNVHNVAVKLEQDTRYLWLTTHDGHMESIESVLIGIQNFRLFFWWIEAPQ